MLVYCGLVLSIINNNKLCFKSRILFLCLKHLESGACFCALSLQKQNKKSSCKERSQKISCFIHNHSSSLLSAPLFTHKSLDLLPKTATYFSWQPGSAAEPLTFCWFARPVQVWGARWICMQHWGALTQRSETEGVGFPFLSLDRHNLTLKKLKGHQWRQRSE